MDTLSVLNTQKILPSNGGVEDITAAEVAAREEAERQQDDFLTLLTTQLANQNPLDPMDTDEFSAQLTRYSQLEQQIAINEKLAVQNAYLQQSSEAQTFNYIGKEVELITNVGVTQDGSAKWSYLIEGDASAANIRVTNEADELVAEFEGPSSPGAHTINFDAAELGLEDGTELFFNLVATDSDNNNLNTIITSQMTVEGVTKDGTETYLTVGNVSFRTSDVLKLIDDPALASGTTTAEVTETIQNIAQP